MPMSVTTRVDRPRVPRQPITHASDLPGHHEDWRHAVGPRELRARRPLFAWRSIETNQFGTDEFMEWRRTSAPNR